MRQPIETIVQQRTFNLKGLTLRRIDVSSQRFAIHHNADFSPLSRVSTARPKYLGRNKSETADKSPRRPRRKRLLKIECI
jgi:hypothetical protein